MAQRANVLGGGYGADGRASLPLGTDYLNVCYHLMVIWTSPLGRTYHARRQPVTTDLPDPLPRAEQYPDYAPPVTVDANWPILYRPPPKPQPPPLRVVDPDEPPPCEMPWMTQPRH